MGKVLSLLTIGIIFLFITSLGCVSTRPVDRSYPNEVLTTPTTIVPPSTQLPSSNLELPPIEAGKGRIIFNYEKLPKEVIIREINDDFLLGVGTTAPEGGIPSNILKNLRIGGVNYYLPFITWASIEHQEGNYNGIPTPGLGTISWLKNSGATLNGHCFIFFHDVTYVTPRFAYNRPFDEQKRMIERFVKTTVARFPEIDIWTLNEPMYQNSFGWTDEQNYDIFVSVSKWVHEVNPKAKVMINMVPIADRGAGRNYEPEKVLDELFKRGLEADIVGVELYHFWVNQDERDEYGYPKIEWIKNKVDIFKKYKLPIIFSEVGIPGIVDNKPQFDKQAEWLEKFIRYCHNDTHVKGIVWYFVVDDSFMPYAGLVESDNSYRPVYYSLLKMANEIFPSTTYTIGNRSYVDIEPGKYDIIINQKIIPINVIEGKGVII